MTHVIVLLNALANGLGACLRVPMEALPGWLSLTAWAAVSGVGMLWIFRHTSNQRAIRRVRDQIQANLLALSLFSDSVAVSLRCQARVVAAAVRLLALSLLPMLVMILPTCLFLGQLGLWYQARPLQVGEEAVLTVALAENVAPTVEARLESSAAAEATLGPVRVPSKHLLCWNLRACAAGYHLLRLRLAGQTIDKQLAIGDGPMRVSRCRPPWSWSQALWHPGETPLAAASPVQSVTIDYPPRPGWLAGSGSWLFYWFAVSMIVAYAARPWLGVNL